MQAEAVMCDQDVQLAELGVCGMQKFVWAGFPGGVYCLPSAYSASVSTSSFPPPTTLFFFFFLFYTNLKKKSVQNSIHVLK